MENNEMEKVKLETEELDPVAGGALDYQKMRCPNCGGKYRSENIKHCVPGGAYWTYICTGCGDRISSGRFAPEKGVIGTEGMLRGAAEWGLTDITDDAQK